jgi:GNAT superfamily N-acetyltransferase
VSVIIRPMKPDDFPFISTRWVSSYDRSRLAQYAGDGYQAGQRKMISRLLHRGATIIVAESVDEPGLLHGFIAREGSSLHWVYVRPEMRRFGVGRQLLEYGNGLSMTHCSHEMPDWFEYRYGYTWEPQLCL